MKENNDKNWKDERSFGYEEKESPVEDEVVRLDWDSDEDKPLFKNQAAANWAVDVYQHPNRLENSISSEQFEITDELMEKMGEMGCSPVTRSNVIRFLGGVIAEVANEPDPEVETDNIPMYFVPPEELTDEERTAYEAKLAEQAEPYHPESSEGQDSKPQADKWNVLDEDGNLQ